MEKNIHFRTIIEVAGTPKEHIEEAIKGFVDQIKSDKNYTVVKEDFAEIKKHEAEQPIWATFAELEIKTAALQEVINFGFDYMPSMVEIIHPSSLQTNNEELTIFMNDLMSKLHAIDAAAKQSSLETSSLRKSLSGLIRNYVLFVLRQQNLSAENLQKATGIQLNLLEDFLDQMIDEGKVDLKEGIYFLK